MLCSKAVVRNSVSGALTRESFLQSSQLLLNECYWISWNYFTVWRILTISMSNFIWKYCPNSHNSSKRLPAELIPPNVCQYVEGRGFRDRESPKDVVFQVRAVKNCSLDCGARAKLDVCLKLLMFQNWGSCGTFPLPATPPGHLLLGSPRISSKRDSLLTRSVYVTS